MAADTDYMDICICMYDMEGIREAGRGGRLSPAAGPSTSTSRTARTAPQYRLRILWHTLEILDEFQVLTLLQRPLRV
jgi:hypothetical protein